MQKKPNAQNQPQPSSSWQDNIKKEQRRETGKKFVIWGIIILASVAGLGLLVKLAGTSGPGSEPVVNENVPKIRDSDILIGDPKAKVTIFEYSDFQCPACAAYNPTLNRLLSEYDGKVNLVYRFFPLRGIHKNAFISSQAGFAAWKLGKFEDMKDTLFDNQTDWENLDDPKETFTSYAKKIGLDEKKFSELMVSGEAKKAVETGEAEALSLGLNSTPTIFIGNKKVSTRTYDDFKKLIEEDLPN